MTNNEAFEILRDSIILDLNYKPSAECTQALELAKQCFKEARPKGKWVFKFDNSLIPTGYWECSECKKGRLLVETKFCPDCGADMQMGGERK